MRLKYQENQKGLQEIQVKSEQLENDVMNTGDTIVKMCGNIGMQLKGEMTVKQYKKCLKQLEKKLTGLGLFKFPVKIPQFDKVKNRYSIRSKLKKLPSVTIDLIRDPEVEET